jgi:hypothetical protein
VIVITYWSTYTCCVTVLLLLVANAGHGEVYNRKNLVPGGRAAAMGGAYAAIADDASAGWHNPSGLAWTKGQDLSMSANAYTKTSRSIEGVLGNEDVAETSSSLYPAFAGGITSFGPVRFGYSYFTLDRENSNESLSSAVPQSATSGAYTYKRKLLSVSEHLLAGGSFAFPMGTHFSLGLSEFYYRRSSQISLAETSLYASGASTDSFLRQTTLNEGAYTVVGGMIHGSYGNFGLVARMPKPLADNTLVETSQTLYTASSQSRSELSQKSHAYDESDTPEYVVGFSLRGGDWLLWSAEGSYCPVHKSDFKSDGGIDTRATTNWATGLELATTYFIMRGGAFSNNSLVAMPDETKSNQPSAIDFLGFSGSLTVRTKSAESSFGMVRQLGQGYEQAVTGQTGLYKVSAESVTYFLSTRYLGF